MSDGEEHYDDSGVSEEEEEEDWHEAASAAAAVVAAAAPATEAPPEAVCYICLGRGDEPLHRNCSCRGPEAGFAHMECLTGYVTVGAVQNPKLWWECGLCKQEYFGAQQSCLSAARWETAKSLADEDEEKLEAANVLGDALRDARHFEPAKPLFEYVLRMRRSLEGDAEPNTLISIANLALLCVSSFS